VALQPVSWPRPPVFFLLSLTCLAAAIHCFVLSNFIAFFHTSSSHLFLGFPAGPLPLRLPFRICFVILLLNILITCTAHFHLLTDMHVTKQIIAFHSSVCKVYCDLFHFWTTISSTCLSFLSPPMTIQRVSSTYSVPVVMIIHKLLPGKVIKF
jgi:hypothetical protein